MGPGLDQKQSIVIGFPTIEESIIERCGHMIMPPLRRQKRQLEPTERKKQLTVAIER